MEEERGHNALKSAAQIQSGVIMKVSEAEDGRISQFRSVQVDTEGSPAKKDYSANEVLRYALIQFGAPRYVTLPCFVITFSIVYSLKVLEVIAHCFVTFSHMWTVHRVSNILAVFKRINIGAWRGATFESLGCVCV
jgi:hypothetical protein